MPVTTETAMLTTTRPMEKTIGNVGIAARMPAAGGQRGVSGRIARRVRIQCVPLSGIGVELRERREGGYPFRRFVVAAEAILPHRRS